MSTLRLILFVWLNKKARYGHDEYHSRGKWEIYRKFWSETQRNIAIEVHRIGGGEDNIEINRRRCEITDGFKL
jgi:hypothetical protein